MIKLTQNQFFGKLEYLPKSMPEGATYTCTDTKEIYLYSSNFVPELISTSGGVSGDGNYDGGTPGSIYLTSQSIDGGTII